MDYNGKTTILPVTGGSLLGMRFFGIFFVLAFLVAFGLAMLALRYGFRRNKNIDEL